MDKIYILNCYERLSDDKSRMLSNVTVELFADSELEAIEKAKTMIQKNTYSVSKVFEKREQKNKCCHQV